METSLGRLQRQVDQLNNQIVRLQDNLERHKQEKENVKKEFKRYKKDVENLIEKAVTKAVAEVKEEYEKIIQEKDQRIFELECRLNINSDTSSLPSSKDPLDKKKTEIQNSREKTDRTVGGQKGHNKHTLEKFKEEEITKIKEHKQTKCPFCGNRDIVTIEVKERDELDFRISIEKIRNKFLTQRCNHCGKVIENKIPSTLHAENQYGGTVKSMIMMLYNYGFVSFSRTRQIICGLTGEQINPSEGYMVKLQAKAGESLSDFVFDAKEVIRKAKLVQWDDTTIRIDEKDKACFRAYTDRKVVLFKAHIAKNTEGMDEDGILQNLSKDTVVVHDHLLHNYCKDYKYQNAECNAHATRKLKGITVNTNHNWSADMEKLLKETLKKRKEKMEKKITSFATEELNEILNEYDEIVNRGFKEYKEFQHKYEYTNEENMLEFLRDYKENITFWMRDFSIPYSNNLVESLLRMTKTKMKISYQFKSLNHAEYFANIRSYTETCGNFGINKTSALMRLFDGNPYTIQELLSLENSQ